MDCAVDKLDVMRLFVRIVERRSFTLAAQDLNLPRATVTHVIKQMEERLGVRLLQRTTRVVSPTLDGEAFARRCVAILADVENAEGAFSSAKPKGILRVEVQGTLARHFLIPALPAFLDDYPDIEIIISEGERWVDVVREGIDCVLRYGHLADSEMVARRVTMIDRMTCAAPAYLERYGTPASMDDLEGHSMIGLRSLTTGNLAPLEFAVDAGYRSIMLPAPVSVTGTESYLATALLGLGIFQVPRFHADIAIGRGELVQILSDNLPPSVPVSLLYPPSRQLSPRVRVFMDWAARQFAERSLDE
jgi:DNA-binding transcriptional LysR family regulator